jgi:hypothetical protein
LAALLEDVVAFGVEFVGGRTLIAVLSGLNAQLATITAFLFID